MSQLPILKSKQQLININSTDSNLTTDVNLNYSKASLNKNNNVTFINIDRAVTGKFEVSNTKTYTQNLVKKYDLTGNKEVCVRKIFIAQREDSLFDITIRELNIYYRKSKKHHFNKVTRFKTSIGTIEYVLEMLKEQVKQKNISIQTNYLLN